MTGPTVGLGLGLGFCAKARKGERPTAVVAAALRKPRRVGLTKDQLPFATDTNHRSEVSLSDGFRKSRG